MRLRGALAALAVAGCGLETGPVTEWIDVTTIAGTLAPEQGTTPPQSMKSHGPVSSLRVVTWNAHLGADPEAQAAALLANPALAAADVYLLQEEEWWPSEHTTRASRLAEALGTGWVYIPGRQKGAGTHGLAILSRFPIESVEKMELPATDNWKRRIAIKADVVVGALRVHVVDVHLETRINITDRILQLRPAVIDLPDDAIVAGDVNTNPFVWEDGEVPLVPTAQVADTDQAPILDDYMRALGFATPAAGVGPTQETLGVQSRLDAIFVRGYGSGTAHVERSVTGSDHWPVWVDVQLP